MLYWMIKLLIETGYYISGYSSTGIGKYIQSWANVTSKVYPASACLQMIAFSCRCSSSDPSLLVQEAFALKQNQVHQPN